MLSRSTEPNDVDDEPPAPLDIDPLDELDEPAEPELDGDVAEPELLPDGEVELLLPPAPGEAELLLPPAPDVLLPAVPIDESELDPPAATARPDAAERAKAKSTALLRTFM